MYQSMYNFELKFSISQIEKEDQNKILIQFVSAL